MKTTQGKEAALLKALPTVLQEVAAPDPSQPIVIFSATWPFLKEMGTNKLTAIDELLDVVWRTFHDHSILMPTFTSGYVDGFCNLDEEPSSTGILTECFRKRKGVRRTLSAFFPFAISGPDTAEVIDLHPTEAWGDESAYAWMEQVNARFLMLGTHPSHCSFLHRLEWLVRERITYRFSKRLEGNLIREGKTYAMAETLFVRKLKPEVINDFTVLMPHLTRAGMRTKVFRGISIASFDARGLLREVLPALREDPLLVVGNRQDFEENS